MMANTAPFDFPLKGKARIVLARVECHEGMINSALEGGVSESFRNTIRRLITAEIFSNYENWKKFPPSVFKHLKRAGRAKIRELTPQLAELIDWDNVTKSQSVPLAPGTCPECGYHDPTWENGSEMTCPYCGTVIPG